MTALGETNPGRGRCPDNVAAAAARPDIQRRDMPRRALTLIISAALGLGAAFGIAACGDDDDSDTTTSAPASATTSGTTTEDNAATEATTTEDSTTTGDDDGGGGGYGY
jgi:hypothetical protein